MKKILVIGVLTLFLLMAATPALATPLSAQPPTTVLITFDVQVTVYTPQENILAGPFTVRVTDQPFVKTEKAYHTDTMWPLIPWLFPSDITGSPVVIAQGRFSCWLRFTSHWPDPPLPLVQSFWGKLTIIDDSTMTGTYFDRGYCISEDYPEDFSDPPNMIPVQIGNSDIWYLGYTEYIVSAVVDA